MRDEPVRRPERPQIRMIAVDMDGTLLGADGCVSERNLRSVRQAEAAGVEVVVATGRRHTYAMRQLRALGLRPDAVIVSSNGTVTRTVGSGLVGSRLVDRTVMPTETATWLCGVLGEFRNALVMTFDRVGEDGEEERGSLVVEQMEALNLSIGKWMAANERYLEHVVPIERALGERAPIQMMVCGTVERMRRAEALLLGYAGVAAAGITGEAAGAEVALSRTEYPERDLSILDILPGGCSKGVALRRLAARRGFTVREMMAIGDNWNDVSMLEIAGRPVLMGNAPADLLPVAARRGWRVGGRHDQDGVAQAIDTYFASETMKVASR